MYFGFCHAFEGEWSDSERDSGEERSEGYSTDLVEQLRRLDPGKEAEVDDSHLPCDLLGVKVKHTQNGRRGVWELKRPHPRTNSSTVP